MLILAVNLFFAASICCCFVFNLFSFVLSDPASPQKVKDFLGRIKFHQDLGHHENLVELVGCCVDQLPLYMIMEDVSLGDLLTFLWTCRKVSQKKWWQNSFLNSLGMYLSIGHKLFSSLHASLYINQNYFHAPSSTQVLLCQPLKGIAGTGIRMNSYSHLNF